MRPVSKHSLSRGSRAFAALVIAAAWCTLFAGCPGHGAIDDGSRTQSAARFGIITLVHSGGSVPGAQDAHVRMTAFFPRHIGATDVSVLKLMNLPDVPDPALNSLEEGQCQLVERSLTVTPPDEDEGGFIDLMDAGELQLQPGEDMGIRLRRRTIPEIFPNVAGVTYELDLGEPSPDGVVITGAGSRDIGEFSLKLHGASIPTLLALDGQPLLGHYPQIDWTDDLQVTWAAGLPSDPPYMRTYLELVGLTFEKSVAIRCRAQDTGQTVIPAKNLRRLARVAGPEATMRLVVRRVSHMPLEADGLDRGQAYYVARDSVLLR